MTSLQVSLELVKILHQLNGKVKMKIKRKKLKRKMGLERRLDSECFKQTSPGTLSKLVLDSPKIM